MNFRKIGNTSCARINNIPETLKVYFANYHIKDDIYEITGSQYVTILRRFVMNQTDFENRYNNYNLIIDTNIAIKHNCVPDYEVFLTWTFTDNVSHIIEHRLTERMLSIPKCKPQFILENCSGCHIEFKKGASCTFRNCDNMSVVITGNDDGEYIHMVNCTNCKVFIHNFNKSAAQNTFNGCTDLKIKCNNCDLNERQVNIFNDSTYVIKYVDTTISAHE